MTQKQLDREVAHATGESVGFIRSHGFSVMIVPTFIPRRRGGFQAAAKQPQPVNPTARLLRKA